MMAKDTKAPRERGNIGFKPSTEVGSAGEDEQVSTESNKAGEVNDGHDDTQTETNIVEREANRIKPGMTFSFHINVGDADDSADEEAETKPVK